MLVARRATQADSRDLWEWRNDPSTRSASLSPDVVPWEDHVAWFDGVRADPQRAIYIVESPSDGGTSVGMCRFDIDPDSGSAEVSINLNPEHRGKRQSKDLLAAAIERLRAEFVSVAQLSALIRVSNQASKRLFVSVGFRLVAQNDGVEVYVLPLTD